MSAKFIAFITAAALSLSALAPTQALARDHNDNRDLQNAIAAILGVAIVGKIIHDKNKRDDKAKKQRHRKVEQKHHRHVQPKHNRHVQPKRPRHVGTLQPRPLPRGVHNSRHRLLPAKCFRTFYTDRGRYRAFGDRCLQHNFRHAARLPHYCKTHIRTDRGPRRIYEARCLRDAGYRLARG